MRYVASLISVLLLMFTSCTSDNNMGLFEGTANIGGAELGGSARYDAASDSYVVTGSGEDIYGTRDEFYYVWKQVSGDLSLQANVEFADTTGHMYRKAGWMIRASLDDDAPYVDALVHGDGLIALQYRLEKGGSTHEVLSVARAPATIRLERTDDLFTLYVEKYGERIRVVANVSVPMPKTAYAGLVVCAHDDTVQETAVFTVCK